MHYAILLAGVSWADVEVDFDGWPKKNAGVAAEDCCAEVELGVDCWPKEKADLAGGCSDAVWV